jgi:small-conductance mechanosensitive channel
LADSVVYQSTKVQVGYDSDVAQVIALLTQAALAQPRVLRDPEPTVQLSEFAPDDLEFTVVYWINDLQNGQGNLRSDINMAILAALRQNSIDIPFPQQVVHNR